MQGSHRDWKMKVVIEKSGNMKNWPEVMEFCDQYGILPILPLNITKLEPFFADIKKFRVGLENMHLLTFSTKCRKCREMVIEDWEMIMEKKSWEKHVQSLWEPCYALSSPALIGWCRAAGGNKRTASRCVSKEVSTQCKLKSRDEKMSQQPPT